MAGNLKVRGGTYYAVLNVPRPHREAVGRSELVMSLRTKDARQANALKWEALRRLQGLLEAKIDGSLESISRMQTPRAEEATRSPVAGGNRGRPLDELSRYDRVFAARHFHAQQVLKTSGVTEQGRSLLMAVSAEEGHTLSYYADILAVSPAVVSRGMFNISEGKKEDAEPLDLVEARIAVDDRRKRGYYLTPTGRQLVRQIRAIYAGEEDDKLRLDPRRAT